MTPSQVRMAMIHQLASDVGMRIPATIIPEGESLLPVGESNKRKLDADLYALPTVADAASRLRAVETERDRRDVQIAIEDIRMEPAAGALVPLVGGDVRLRYNRIGFGQLAAAIKPADVRNGFGSTLLALPPRIRAEAFNHFADHASLDQSSEAVVLRTTVAPKRTESGGVELTRTLGAVVSPRYVAINDADVLDDLAAALPDGARIRYTESETRSDIEVLWPAMRREIRVGDLAVIALSVSNSQTKQGSLKVSGKVLRVLCSNFTTAWGQGREAEVSMIHLGNTRRNLAEAIRSTLRDIEPFILAFGDAYQKDLPAFAPTRSDVLRRAEIALGVSPKVIEAAADVWDADGDKSAGNTLAGLANAITRAAQELTMDAAATIERSVGRLIRTGWAALEG